MGLSQTITLFFSLTFVWVSPSHGDLGSQWANIDPFEFTWVKSWAALGDSWASGLGSGAPLQDPGSYLCERYNESYPQLINRYIQVKNPDVKFNFAACSGATLKQITGQADDLEDQSQSFITVNGGLMDLGFVQILNACIFQWSTQEDSDCDSSLEQGLKTIESRSFTENLNGLFHMAQKKLATFENGTIYGKIYYVGYPRFWGSDYAQSQCDHVSWSFWPQWPGQRRMLTQTTRSKMNYLVIALNGAVQKAVKRSFSANVEFANFDRFFTELVSGYCVEGNSEPAPQRIGLLLYEPGSNSFMTPPDNMMSQDDRPKFQASPGLVMKGTLNGHVNEFLDDELKKRPQWRGIWSSTGGDPSIDDVNATAEQKAIGVTPNLIPDGFNTAFQLNPMGNNMAANLIPHIVVNGWAKVFNMEWYSELVETDGACPAHT